MDGKQTSVLWLSVLAALVTFNASAAHDILPPVFEEIPVQRKIADDTVYADVMAYSVEAPFGDAHGRPTNVHETAHGIHATYRNQYRKKLGKRINAFYMLRGQIAVVEEPDFLIRNVQKHIPKSLRGYRYQLYFVDQLRDWDDTPLYVFDEWNAYICGGESAVSDYKQNNIKADSDAVSGCLEFSIYAVATYLAAKERVPEYLAKKPQMKSVLYYNLTRADAAFYDGCNIFTSAKQDQLYENLQHCADAKPIRECLRKEFKSLFLETEAEAHEQSDE